MKGEKVMKNRKTVVVLFMLVAVMISAVGFALYNDTLDIVGTMEVGFTNANNAFDADVYFSAVDDPEIAEISSLGDGDSASFRVTTLTAVGQSVTVGFTITNDNAFAAQCTLNVENTNITSVSDTRYFGGSITVDGAELEKGESFTIDAESSKVIYVTVTLNETPQLDDANAKITGTYNIQLDVVDVG